MTAAPMQTVTIGPLGNAYRGCRTRITELLQDLGEQRAAATRVPACPEWSVRDVVSHVTGVIADAIAGRLDGAGTDAWTAAQVEARRGMSLAEILREWESCASQAEAVMDEVGEQAIAGVADVTTHEHDLRAALGQPGARDSDAIPIALGFAAQHLLESAAAHGVSLQLVSTDGLRFGAPDAEVTLTDDPFPLLRAITGRRSVDQLRELKWEGDCERALPAFWWDPLHPAASAIVE